MRTEKITGMMYKINKITLKIIPAIEKINQEINQEKDPVKKLQRIISELIPLMIKVSILIDRFILLSWIISDKYTPYLQKLPQMNELHKRIAKSIDTELKRAEKLVGILGNIFRLSKVGKI